MVGDVGDDPGAGWEVCGVADGTKDHTLVRKSSVVAGNEGAWIESAGTDADDCEWIVLDQNDWTMLGFHEMDAMSNEYIVELMRESGTSLLKILSASPSAKAVFPTPGSPTNIGLFLFLLDKM